MLNSVLFSLRLCYAFHGSELKIAFFSTPWPVMTIHSTSLTSELRPRCTECSFMICSLQTIYRSSPAFRGGPPVTHSPLCRGILKVRPHHQPPKNIHHGPSCQYYPCNLQWRPQPGCGRKVHLPWLHHLQQLFLNLKLNLPHDGRQCSHTPPPHLAKRV